MLEENKQQNTLIKVVNNYPLQKIGIIMIIMSFFIFPILISIGTNIVLAFIISYIFTIISNTIFSVGDKKKNNPYDFSLTKNLKFKDIDFKLGLSLCHTLIFVVFTFIFHNFLIMFSW